MRGGVYIGDAVNWDASLNRGLVSWWLALPDQQRGNVFRDLCLRNPGQLTNGPLWSGVSHPGGWGSLFYDGTDDEVKTAVVPFVAPPFTIGAWIRPAAFVTALYKSVVSRGAVFENDTNFAMGWRADNGRLYCYWRNGATLYGNEGSIADPLVWTHVIAVVKASFDLEIFKNGVSVLTDGSNATPTDGGQAFVVGGANTYTSNDRTFHGYVDDAFVRSGDYSAQAMQLYHESLAGHPTTLNWHRPRVYFDMGAAPPGGNRRRRVLICGAAA